jgi:acid phosphatase (class A)
VNTSTKTRSLSSRPVRLPAILFALAIAVAPLHAAEKELHYLATGKPAAATLLAPPPLMDSAEQAADLEEVKAVYHAASDADKNAAYAEKKFSVFNFTAAVGPFFIATNLPKTTAFFEKVQLDAETVTDLGKDFFHRPRPFTTDPSLANGKLEKSFSYPSGHSTESMVLALVLADLLPDKHDAILAHARQMGWHRVQIARHYPMDIYAGRVLAQAIVKQLKKSETFEQEFDAAKAEIEAARTAAKN